ncbi:MAG: alpha/beta hydrolase, partial [Actinobacteria bacterium]|nr:alpha/beta hydrolase [Actinomycetota bacterium]
IKIIAVDGAKHLWVGEPYVNRVLSEINSIVTGDLQALPLEF